MRSLLIIGLGLAEVACTAPRCGGGTVEHNGECVPASAVVTPSRCGPGTVPDPAGSGTCVPEARCGAPGSNTVAGDGGLCVGVGGATAPDAGACATPLPCPPQTPNEFCVTGRVTTFLSDQKPAGMREALGPQHGACVKIYNPTGFVVGDRTPLGTRLGADGAPEAPLDECGRFLIHRVPATTTRFVAAAVDDCDGSGEDRWVLTGVGGEQLGSETPIDLFGEYNAVAIEKSTSDAWTAMAGRDLYGAGGSYIGCYRTSGAARNVAGVVPTAPGTGYITAANTIYFLGQLSELDPDRSDARFARGTDETGCVLINPPQITNHGGMGGGVEWMTTLGGSADGAYFVHRFRTL